MGVLLADFPGALRTFMLALISVWFGVFLAIAQPCVPHKGPPGWALGSSSERESRGLDLKVPFEPFKSLTCAGMCVCLGMGLPLTPHS